MRAKVRRDFYGRRFMDRRRAFIRGDDGRRTSTIPPEIPRRPAAANSVQTRGEEGGPDTRSGLVFAPDKRFRKSTRRAGLTTIGASELHAERKRIISTHDRIARSLH